MSVHFSNATTGWAGGTAGAIVKTTDGGTTWRLQQSGTNNNIRGLFGFDIRTAWAVGDGGTILKASAGGY